MGYEIKEDIENREIIKRSEFITRLFKVNSVSEADEIIKRIKQVEKNATHNCHAYRILNGTTVFESRSDDGEPAGTAGSPMLSVLAGNDIVNILAIITRYFGGTKLGTGGLVKAYSDGVKKTLEKSVLVEYISKKEKIIYFRINNTGKINYFIETNNIEIKDREFTENVKYELLVTADQENKIDNELSDFLIK